MHQLWHKMQVMCKFELKHDGDGPPQKQQISWQHITLEIRIVKTFNSLYPGGKD